MFVKPMYPIVRDPATRIPLPKEGAEVPENAYWMTRLRHGDVELVEKPAEEKPADETHDGAAS